MAQCQFVYQRSTAIYSVGEWCSEVGWYLGNSLCEGHHMRKDSLSTAEGSIGNSFPRIQMDAEQRMCVDEVRRRTSPENVMLRSCVVCG